MQIDLLFLGPASTHRRAIFDRCEFTNNAGADYGGAIELWQIDYASFTDCVFRNNTVRF